MEAKHTYRCCNQKCSEYNRDFPSAMSPSDYRLATGESVTCAFCGQAVWYRPGDSAPLGTARVVLESVDRANGGCWDGFSRQTAKA